jgi:hypothetical protein
MDGGAAVYGYDGEGRRMKKTVGSETTYYFYGPGGLLCEFSTSNALSSATSASSTDRITYRTSDKLGSAVLIINSAGLIIDNNRTLPYGGLARGEYAVHEREKIYHLSTGRRVGARLRDESILSEYDGSLRKPR